MAQPESIISGHWKANGPGRAATAAPGGSGTDALARRRAGGGRGADDGRVRDETGSPRLTAYAVLTEGGTASAGGCAAGVPRRALARL
ncbi:hypothetical protein [Streptomyces sp. NPDC031705]|uniref:hypothetical protein n=1 Tax=Streptomyces sp. NPDC031705 TaxID=3155729 RepID=UPI003410289D